MLKKILLSVSALLLLLLLGIYIWLSTLKPSYDGELKIKGLTAETEILYDEYAIPHIYAKNEQDAFFALGYAHAQERLFQMELLRRVGGGRLSEIFGKDLIAVDKLFRTLGIEEQAVRCAQKYLAVYKSSPEYHAAFAYLDGINYYMDHGKTPVEFTMLGIKKQHFTVTDLYRITGYMAFSFAEASRTDPILSKIQGRYGMEYLADLAMVYSDSSERIPVMKASKEVAVISNALSDVIDKVPASPFIGSNSWVIAPWKSETGKVLFANDTHIGFSSPSVWYEAHLEYPGMSLYGNFLAGFPFPLVGHTRHHAWGLTMFENDDMDLYAEKDNSAILSTRSDTILVKNAAPEIYSMKTTAHGPVVNGIVQAMDSTLTYPVSLSWTYTKMDPQSLESGYIWCHAHNLGEFEKGVEKIHAPGLNVMYGDSSGNIAWWAAAKIAKYHKGIMRKLILNGADSINDITGYYSFSENPHNINPACGYVYSANNQPDFDSGEFYQGYYAPGDRAARILSFLNTDSLYGRVHGDSIWDVDRMKMIITDVTSDVHKKIAHDLAILVSPGKEKIPYDSLTTKGKAIRMLDEWDGDHQTGDIAPTIYWTWLSFIMRDAMADEMGENDYETLAATHFIKNSIPKFLKNDNSVWWDDVNTKNKKETKKEIVLAALDSAMRILEEKLGRDVEAWGWGRVHTLEQVHAIGRKKPFNNFFNVGPVPVMGGNETINNQGFHLSTTADFKVTYGPAMRILLDFSDIENSISVNPMGQSGYFMSSHYDDQSKMYNEGEFRKQMMNRKEIEKEKMGRVVMKPE